MLRSLLATSEKGNAVITLRPHQQKALDWAAERRRGIIQSPAGSGKTVMMAAIAKAFLDANPQEQVGVLAPTNETCAQSYESFQKFGIPMESVEIRCPHGSVDFSGKQLVLVDECKHFPSDQWSNCLRGKIPSRFFGFDATPFKDFDDERNDRLLNVFGDEILTIDHSEIGSSLCTAKVILSDATDLGLERRIDAATEKLVAVRKRFMRTVPDGELRAMCLWQTITDIGITNNGARNRQVGLWMNAHKDDQALVLVPTVTLGEHLAKMAPWAKLVHSKLGKSYRKKAMEDYRSGALRCMIATSLADEGLDLPNAKVLILVSGGRSSQKTIQRTARVLRDHHTKDGAIIYDFNDLFHPVAAKHAQNRQRIYREMEYEFA